MSALHLDLPPVESAQRFVEDFHPNTLKYTTRTQLESIESKFYQPTVKYLGEFVEHSISALGLTSYPFAEPIITLDQIETYVKAWLQGVGLFEQGLQAAYEKEVASAYQDALALGMTAAGKELGFKVDLNVGSPAALAFAKAESAKLVTGVWATTKLKMGDAIRSGIAEGLPRDDVAKKLRKIKEDLPDWRSKLIAQTETTKALNGGQLLYYKEAGVKNKEWLDGQAKACPSCQGANHQVVPIDKPFLTSFGPISAPPAHPGCRCSMNAVINVPVANPETPNEIPIGKEVSGKKAEADFIRALDAAQNADSVIKTKALEPYVDKAPEGLEVWHTGNQPGGYWYVSNTSEGALLAGRGELTKWIVKSGANVYPDPEIILGERGAMDKMYTGMKSLVTRGAAIIKRSDLIKVP